MIVPEDDKMIILVEYQQDFLTEELMEEEEFDVKDEDENLYKFEYKIEYDDIEEEDVKIEEDEEYDEIKKEPIQIIVTQESYPYSPFDQDSSCSTQMNYEVEFDVKIEVKIKIEVEVEVEDQFEPQHYFYSYENLENQENFENVEISESGQSTTEECDSDIEDFCQNLCLIQPTGVNKFILYDCFTKYQFIQSTQNRKEFCQYSAQKQEYQ